MHWNKSGVNCGRSLFVPLGPISGLLCQGTGHPAFSPPPNMAGSRWDAREYDYTLSHRIAFDSVVGSAF